MKNKFVKIFSLIFLIAVCATCLTACWPGVHDYEEGLFEFKGEVDDTIDKNTGRPWESAEFINGLTIEYASINFEKIGLAKFNKQNGRNVIKNPKNLKKYLVKLFVKFVGETEGKYYDFDYRHFYDSGRTHGITVHFIDVGKEHLTFDARVSMAICEAQIYSHNKKQREGTYVFFGWRVYPSGDIHSSLYYDNNISFYKQR